MKNKRIITLAYCILLPLCFESLLRISTVGSFDIRFIYVVVFSIPAGAFLFALTGAFSKRANKIVFNTVNVILAIYYIAQIVYFVVFKSYFGVSQIAMGGAAVANFTDQTKIALAESIVPIIAYIIVIVATIVLSVKNILCFEKYELKQTAINFASVLLIHMLCLSTLLIGGTGAYSIYDIYHSDDTSTSSSVINLGVLVTTRLEIQHLLFGDLYAEEPAEKITNIDYPEYSSEEYNVLDIDFNAILKKSEYDPDVATLTAALAEREPTKKNEYTGMFKDKNLITICAESFSPYLIDKERTPTLYKLANEGFIFNNFYNSYESNTTNGEYTYCMGMFPDLSRSKVDNSFLASADNELPFTLANMFKSKGVKSYAYHNFLSTYYTRYLSHPNMGYDVFKTPDNGLDIAPTWPSSDMDMMYQSVDDYISSGEQFHAYYMTFSGHYHYNWENVMDAKNKSLVKDLDYSEKVKCYIAGNMELEFALEYLMQRLEEEGIADDTVIVLTADHYPYGLTDDEYNELAGKEVDKDFEMYHSSFICWSGDMEETVEINDFCSTIDILPTLLNLFGFEYDSRLIMGRDVLSDAEPIAIISNQTFITKDYRFNATDNDTIITSETAVADNVINSSKNYVKEILNLSKLILNTNYYQYVSQKAG